MSVRADSLILVVRLLSEVPIVFVPMLVLLLIIVWAATGRVVMAIGATLLVMGVAWLFLWGLFEVIGRIAPSQ